jgi:hypothetical protein
MCPAVRSKAAHVRSDIGRYGMMPEWLLTSGVSDRAIRLFAVLAAKYADRDGVAYPSRARLAKDLGLAQAKTVDAPIQELCDVGALTIRKRFHGDGSPQSNEYLLEFSRPAEEGVVPEQGLPSPPSGTTVAPDEGLGSPQLGAGVVPGDGPRVVPGQGHDPGKYLTRSIEPEREAPAAPPLPPVLALVERWNRERVPGPKVEHVSLVRTKALQRALDEHPDLDIWSTAIAWLNGQPWANAPGSGAAPTWRATLDWLTKPGQLEKILEQAEADRTAPPRRRNPADPPTYPLTEAELAAKADRQRRLEEYHAEQDALHAEAAQLVLELSAGARASLEREVLVELERFRSRLTSAQFDDLVLRSLPKALIDRADGQPLVEVAQQLERGVAA